MRLPFGDKRSADVAGRPVRPLDKLEAAAAAAEQRVGDTRRAIEAKERELGQIVEELGGAISANDGAAIVALGRRRNNVQDQLASLKQDQTQAVEVAKAARGTVDGARLADRWVTQSDEEGAALRGIEEALRAVPAPWAAWERAWEKRRALDAELVKFRRRNPNVTVAAPSSGGSLLTSDLLALAKNVGPALAVLDGLRRERQNPPAKPESVGPLIFIAGDSPRALAQRAALGRSQPAPARTHGRQ